MDDEEWLKVAMEDDSVVVDLLLLLNRPHSPTPMADSFAFPLPLDWAVRQRRSRPLSTQEQPRNKSESLRTSPTTPLSWSGATSASGALIDGFEDSSRPVKSLDSDRSEIEGKNAVSRTAKRCRKKKTLPELKEEHSLLFKERNILETALTTLRIAVENERATNINLKKMKVDLQAKSSYDSTPTVPANVDINVVHSDLPLTKSQDSNTIVLPDLNLPVDESSVRFPPRMSYCFDSITPSHSANTEPNSLTLQN